VFDRIVVAIDFSARSLAAARWAAQHVAPQARVHFVHVLPEPAEPSFMRRRLTGLREVMTDVSPALGAGLQNVGTLLAPGRSTVEVRRGEVVEELTRAAEDVGAGMICLGRRRSRRGGARFGATTAHRLLTRSPTAVLIVPTSNDGTPSRISVALDDHAGRQAVLGLAMQAARTWSADVRALHVLSPALRDLMRSVRPADGMDGVEDEPREDDARTAGERTLVGRTRTWLTGQLEASHGVGTLARAQVRIGDPGQEILAEAHASRADLIVLGRASASGDGVTASGPFPLGSTTRLVTWAAPCAVLVAPPRLVPSPAPRPTRSADARRTFAGVSAA
jgi:nucleotide-binding universal stress UspA family protein